MRTRFEIPQGFTDEVRFFRYLPLRSLLILLVVAIPGIILFKLLSPFGLGIYVFFAWVIIEFVIVAGNDRTDPVGKMERWGRAYI